MIRENVEQRTRRLLLLLQAIKPNTRTPLSEFVRLTGTTREELVNDLQLLSMCAVDQRDPTSFVPILIDNDCVEIFGHVPALNRPVRFSTAEARAVIAALRVAGVPVESELHRKLSLAAGNRDITPEEIGRRLHASSSLTSQSAEYLKKLTSAVKRHQLVLMAYRGVREASAANKTVEPLALIYEKDVWYAYAYCRDAQDMRTYRLDRIEDLKVTGERFEPRPFGLPDSALPLEELPLARIRFGPDEKIDSRDWPGIRVIATEKDGSRVAEIPYTGSPWLARRVMACLGGAEALTPSGLREAVADLADELLGEHNSDIADRQR